MGKMNELSALLDDLEECGRKLTATALGIKEYFSGDVESKPEEKQKEKAYTKTDVRELLAKKAEEDDGKYKVAVKELVKKYANGGTLTDIPEDKYSDLVSDLEVVGNG